MDWARTGSQITDHRRGPGDDPLGRVLGAITAPGGVLSLTSVPHPDRDWPRIVQSGVEEVWVAAGGAPPPGTTMPVRFDVDPEPVHTLHRAPAFRREHGRPWVVLKAATTIDGRIASHTGASQWITGARARGWGRRLRGEVDAIAVGIETAMLDDPQLTARWGGARDPVRVVFDRQLRLPRHLAVVRTAAQRPTWVITCAPTPDAPAAERRAHAARQAALEADGVQVCVVDRDVSGRPDVAAAVVRFAQAGWSGLLVEGGPTLAGAFFDAGLVDYVSWFVAPALMGGQAAPAAVGGRGADAPATALGLELEPPRRIGRDWLFEGWVRGRRPARPLASG